MRWALFVSLMNNLLNSTKIYIAGHRWMVGSAILRRLEARHDTGDSLELVTRSHPELDLTNKAAVRRLPPAASLCWWPR